MSWRGEKAVLWVSERMRSLIGAAILIFLLIWIKVWVVLRGSECNSCVW